MNRIIKFRVWDDFRKIYLDNRSFSFRFGNDGQLRGIHDSFNEIEKYIVQQFTGLLDKNNKEIYEGDILKVAGFNKLQKVSFDNLNRICFNNETADYAINCIFGEGMSLEAIETEIENNIFQNPDLINGN